MFLIWTDPRSSELSDERGFTEILQEWLSVKNVGGNPWCHINFSINPAFILKVDIINILNGWIKSLYMRSFRVTTPQLFNSPAALRSSSAICLPSVYPHHSPSVVFSCSRQL